MTIMKNQRDFNMSSVLTICVTEVNREVLLSPFISSNGERGIWVGASQRDGCAFSINDKGEPDDNSPEKILRWIYRQSESWKPNSVYFNWMIDEGKYSTLKDYVEGLYKQIFFGE